MKNYIKYLIGLLIFIPSVVLAINITVPSAPSDGYYLISTTTGAYVVTASSTLASSTNYWSKLGSNLYYLVGNVGIGTTTPSSALDVVGDINISNAYKIGGSNRLYDGFFSTILSPSSNHLLIYNGSNNGLFDVVDSSGTKSLSFAQNSNNGLIYTTGTTNLVLQPTSGNVGIGTTTGISTLDIQGTGGVMPFRISSSTGVSIIEVEQNGNVGIGTTSAVGVLSIAGQSGATTDLFVVATATPALGLNAFTVASNGNVGVGNTVPGLTLDVSRNLGVSSGQNELFRVFNGATAGIAIGYRANGTSVNGGYIRSTGSLPMYLETTGMPQAVTLLNTGHFGIGSTTPSARLSVTGFGGTTQITFRTTNSSNVPTVTVLDNGNSGFGTTSPQNKIDVGGSVSIGTGFSTAAPTNGLIIQGNTGVGTSTPAGKLAVSGTSGNPLNPVLLVASSTNASLFTVDGAAHVITGGVTPTVSSCGTGATLSATSNDTSGTVSVGTGVVTSCTITFGVTRSRIPNFVSAIISGTAIATGYSAKSTTAVTFTLGANLASGAFNYLVIE